MYGYKPRTKRPHPPVNCPSPELKKCGCTKGFKWIKGEWKKKEIIDTVTCQICERNIEANTGVLAHHGYKRPGDGYQTPSCFGARSLPYEVAKDKLPIAIKHLASWIVDAKQSLKNFLENPPETLTRPAYTWRKPPTVYTRPEGYKLGGYYYGKDSGYDAEYKDRKYYKEKNLKWAEQDLERLTKRLANWKQVWTEEEFKKMVTPK